MYNLFRFKKSKNPLANEVVTVENPKLSPEISIDERIYQDVYSAQELLLKEANEILSYTPPFDEEKYERLLNLHDLGFGNAEEVKFLKSVDQNRKEQAELKAKIEYYQQSYPLNRFISEASVEKVCAKYNLLLAKSWDYLSEIPDKNQKEIVSFKLIRKDYRRPKEVLGGTSFYHFDYDPTIGQSEEEKEIYNNEKIQPRNLLIIAPAHKLRTEGRERSGHVLKIKDPIVLQPVEFGYLIVSSWGFEAGDEMVVNANHN